MRILTPVYLFIYHDHPTLSKKNDRCESLSHGYEPFRVGASSGGMRRKHGGRSSCCGLFCSCRSSICRLLRESSSHQRCQTCGLASTGYPNEPIRQRYVRGRENTHTPRDTNALMGWLDSTLSVQPIWLGSFFSCFFSCYYLFIYSSYSSSCLVSSPSLCVGAFGRPFGLLQQCLSSFWYC